MDDEKPRRESIIRYSDPWSSPARDQRINEMRERANERIRESIKDYYDYNPHVEPDMKALISVLESWQEDQKELQDPPEAIPVPTGFDIEWE